jgi:hypothetical protein
MNPNGSFAARSPVALMAIAATVICGCARTSKDVVVAGGDVGTFSGITTGSTAGGDASAGATIGATTRPAAPGAGVAYVTGSALARMVGEWRVSGKIESGPEQTLVISGSARGTIENTYFLRLDLRFRDPRTGGMVRGSSVIGQTGGRGVEMSSTFSSSPQVKRFRGQMDAAGDAFELMQFEPPHVSRRLVLTLTDTGMTVEAWEGKRRVELYTFARP